MKKELAALALVLSCTALSAAGCAKRDLVRTEEPVTATAVSGAAQPGAAAAAGSEAKEEAKAASAAEGTGTSAPGAAPGAQDLSPLPDTAKLAEELQRIHFGFDSYLLTEQARGTLLRNAELLKNAPRLRVRIAGHCDERGSDDYNLALSEQRARSAKRYLVDLGIPEERLAVIGFGKEKPLEPGHDEAAWAANRRDEFEIVQP